MLKPSKILILSPHPDDAEMGAGGTISKFLDEDVQFLTMR